MVGVEALDKSVTMNMQEVTRKERRMLQRTCMKVDTIQM